MFFNDFYRLQKWPVKFVNEKHVRIENDLLPE